MSDDAVPYSRRLVPISHRLQSALGVGTQAGHAHIDMMVERVALMLDMDTPVTPPSRELLTALLPELEEVLSNDRRPGLSEGYYEIVAKDLVDYSVGADDAIAILADLKRSDRPLRTTVTPITIPEILRGEIKDELEGRIFAMLNRWEQNGIFKLKITQATGKWRSERQRTA